MKCLVYLPHSYTGRGPAESCIRIIAQFSDAGIDTTVFIHRARAAVPRGIGVFEAGGGLMRRLPFRMVAPFTAKRLQSSFRQAVEAATPGTVAYFWPNTPVELVRHAKRNGLICVREMINSPLAKAKPILDAAYRDAGLDPAHGITDAMVAQENAELALYDCVFSSNAEVDAALKELGIGQERILASTFGWTGARFSNVEGQAQSGEDVPFRAAFVGLMNVRKGIATLLEAWELAGIEGELVLAGTPETALAARVAEASRRPGVRHVGHIDDVGALYRSSDVFVFPTHEEGGPQVTFEAAACGLPVITTPMGAARLVQDDETGLIVSAGDAPALARAMQRAARDADLRQRLAMAAKERVALFEYRVVGRQRAELLLEKAFQATGL